MARLVHSVYHHVRLISPGGKFQHETVHRLKKAFAHYNIFLF